MFLTSHAIRSKRYGTASFESHPDDAGPPVGGRLNGFRAQSELTVQLDQAQADQQHDERP